MCCVVHASCPPQRFDRIVINGSRPFVERFEPDKNAFYID